MTSEELEKLKFPIGKYEFPVEVSQLEIENWIETIAEMPGKLNNIIRPLNDEQLDTPYRPGGWSIRQLVHHIAESYERPSSVQMDTYRRNTYDQDL